jgi:hypothetical protein
MGRHVVERDSRAKTAAGVSPILTGPKRQKGVAAMLDAYIIDSIRRDDEARERAFERRRIYAELPIDRDHPRQPARRDDEPFMGDPVVIPLIGPEDIEDDAA